MRKGFSIVELSVVMVVIALLVGGILVAQSMISTAKLQKFITEMQQYQSMVMNFQSQYNSFPGDSKNFDPAGNNDGLIGPNCTDTWEHCQEIANFWVHMNKAALTPSGITYTTHVDSGMLNSKGSVINVPHLSFSDAAQVLALSDGEPSSTNPSNNANNGYRFVNHWFITDKTHDNIINDVPIMQTKDALAIDVKIDDGMPLTGDVRGTRDTGPIMHTNVYCGGENPPSICNQSHYQCINGDSEKYDLAIKGLQCSLSIVMSSKTN